MYVLYNGNFIDKEKLSVNYEDRGYQFGDGIYEVIRIYNRKPLYMDQHLTRLEKSADGIRLNLPTETIKLNEQLNQLIKLNNLQDGIIYLQVTRGVAVRNHAFPLDSKPILIAYTKEISRPSYEIDNGVKVVTIEDIRWLKCNIKSINLLGNVLAKQYAVEKGAREAIQIRNGIITEGSASNFFIIKDKKIFTHPANNLILRGITRDIVADFTEKLDIPFIEKEFTLEEALTADEAFITSTTQEIMPVLTIDDKQLDTKPGEITRRLQTEYLKLITINEGVSQRTVRNH